MQTTVTIEGLVLPIRPTPLKQLWPALAALTRASDTWTDADWDAIHAAIFYGIRRAGGEVTLEWVAMNIDLHSFGVLKAFAELNTLETAKPGTAAGEAEGAAP